MDSYTKVCFVVMPFGSKKVGDPPVEVDFDWIYKEIFVPAVAAVKLPEGGYLEPRRTDKDFFSASISAEMFQYLEYSRLVLADISGLNPNVFYELGVRHRARQAGTVILRQVKLAASVPFDIKDIKVFSYECDTEGQLADPQELIARVLKESLARLHLDSPVRLVLSHQQILGQPVQQLLQEAQEALHRRDPVAAASKCREVLRTDPENYLVHQKLGLLLKDRGDWRGALDHFASAVLYSPSYAEAHREKGIAENKLYAASPATGLPTGEEALRRAIELNPEDCDALAALGGVLKRLGRYGEALEMYRRATDVSQGYSYPLLNEVKLAVFTEGRLDLDPKRKFMLSRAERILRQQVSANPPANLPWSFFDLSEVRLYLGDGTEFLRFLEEGVLQSARWQARTHRESLQLLVDGGMDSPELGQGMAKLTESEKYLPE